jgi:2-methylcitrate dehydratase
MHGGPEPTTIAGRLAAFTHGFSLKTAPPEVVKSAQLVLLDSLGCALGALGCDAARILEESIEDFGGGNPEATLFGSGLRTNVLNAVIVNGTLVRYLDASDAYIVLAPRGGSAGAHPSDAVAMVLALAERQGISGLEVLEAIVLAYQLYGGLSHYEMVPLAWKGWTMEAKGPLVTPLIAGRLLGLREDQLEQAVAISGTHGFPLGILDSEGEEYGMTKSIRFPRIAQQGILAAYQAGRGFTGTRRVIEGNNGWKDVIMQGEYDLDHLDVDPGTIGWVVSNAFIKTFTAEGTQQGHLNATWDLITKHDIRAEDVERVDLLATRRTVTHCAGPEKRDPHTKELADHSAYFVTAAMIVDRALGPAQYLRTSMENPEIRALMERVSIEPDPDLDPTVVGGASTITLRSGEVFTSRVEYSRGHPLNPMSYEDEVEKFMALAIPVVGEVQARRVERAVTDLAAQPNVADLMNAMTVS